MTQLFSNSQPSRHGAHVPRQDGLNTEAQRGDPYRAGGKIPEPAVCPECQASFRQGRWSWEPAEAGATPHRCPACERIRDGMPAGQLTLSGAFLDRHSEEIMRLVNNTEEQVRLEHPMERLIAVDTGGAGLAGGSEAGGAGSTVELAFTGIHITHAVGKAIEAAYGGSLEAPYGEAGTLLRSHWHRD